VTQCGLMQPTAPRASTRSALVRIGALAALLVLASFIGYKLGWFDYRHTMRHVVRLRRSYGLGPFTIGFIVVYGLGAAVGMPALPFTVAAGVLFGTLLGSILSWVGALVAAAVGYWTAKRVAREVVLRWIRRYKHADAAIEDSRDFDGMLRLRLLPVLPLGVVNFVGGLARAPFWPYMAATAIGVIPATLIYSYFADSLFEGVGGGRANALVSLGVSSALLILLSLTPRLVRRISRRHALVGAGPAIGESSTPPPHRQTSP
jgi:uncharacterized membrane protein YdjX (TVP38/TMEM64 family)